MEKINQALLSFLDASPTCFHAVENLKQRLLENGYQQLLEFQPWNLEADGKYFVVRGDSSLIAFRLPGEIRGFMIAAAHSDSPAFKVREEAEAASAGGCVRLSVEPYGGMIHRSWLDRPLSVAGRVVVREDELLRTKLVNVDRDLLVIPSVAIHMDRSVNKGTELNPAVDLLPLFSGGEKGAFRRLIAETAGVREEDLLSTDLYLYPRVSGTFVGVEQEFIAASRLDDLQCVFGCLQGFLAAEKSDRVPVLCVFNNEEVGSGTRQGADSTFLTDVLGRICPDKENYMTAVANSFMVSADNAHAIHPAHPEYADKQEFPVLGGGIVIKYNANQRYTTDAVSAAVFAALCGDAGVPVQRFSNRADLPGGSTLGNICSAHLSIPAVDIGLPQLAMHSSYELASARDTEYLVRAMTKFYESSFQHLPDGGMKL